MPEPIDFPEDIPELIDQLGEQAKREFEENLKICLDALHNYTPEKWMDWVEDQLNYSIANPMFPSFDSTRYDDIVELFLHFQAQNISAVHYQTALMKTLQRLVDQLKLTPTDGKLKTKCQRLASALAGSKEPVQDTDLLLQMFWEVKYEDVIIEDDDVVLKAYLLQILSRAPVSKNKLDKILLTATDYVLTKNFDLIYISGVLRIAWRQYSAKKFFEVFLVITTSISERNLLTQRVIVNMVDVINSVGFYSNKEFIECFDEFMSQLVLIPNTKTLVDYINKDEAIADYRTGKID